MIKMHKIDSKNAFLYHFSCMSEAGDRMKQIWFISIVVNFLCGLVLSADMMKKRFPSLLKLKKLFLKTENRLWLGLGLILTGILTLLSATQGDIPVIGDLVPALCSFAGGTAILLEFYNEKNSAPPKALAVCERFLSANRTLLGIVCIATAVLHFFLSDLLFL